MLNIAMTTATRIDLIVLIAVLLWLLLAAATATYGANRGFRFWPLLACGLLIGFPWVLLAVTIATPLVSTGTRTVDDAPVSDATVLPAA